MGYPVGVHDAVDEPGVLVSLTGVPLINLHPFLAGFLVGAAVGGDQGAVQDDVRKFLASGLFQGFFQGRGFP